jgi:hypothetical protein
MTLQFLKTGSRRVATLVGAVAIAAIIVAGSQDVAQAAMTVANNSVNSAKVVDNSIQGIDIKNNTVAGVDVLNGSLTTADLNPAIRPRYAKVQTGTTFGILRHRGATAVNRTGGGEYDVSFDIAITNCGWIATRNDDSDGGAGPGTIAVEQATSSDPTRLRIRLFNTAGTQIDPEDDDGFTVTVIC